MPYCGYHQTFQKQILTDGCFLTRLVIVVPMAERMPLVGLSRGVLGGDPPVALLLLLWFKLLRSLKLKFRFCQCGFGHRLGGETNLALSWSGYWNLAILLPLFKGNNILDHCCHSDLACLDRKTQYLGMESDDIKIRHNRKSCLQDSVATCSPYVCPWEPVSWSARNSPRSSPGRRNHSGTTLSFWFGASWWIIRPNIMWSLLRMSEEQVSTSTRIFRNLNAATKDRIMNKWWETLF